MNNYFLSAHYPATASDRMESNFKDFVYFNLSPKVRIWP